MKRKPVKVIVASGILVAATSSFGQLRFADWNITFYDHGRINEFETALYGVYEGRRFAPDVLVCQEIISDNARTNFLYILNNAVGSPRDWDASPFINGNDTESLFFYRKSRVRFLSTTIVSLGSSDSDNQPRNIYRYDFQPIDYFDDSTVLHCYSSHMKAGGTATDRSRRAIEAYKIRSDAAMFAPGTCCMVAGDFNIPTSSETAYQQLVNASFGEASRFFDPIASPGSWHENPAYSFIDTQDPAGGGGMDDRFDQILLSKSLLDGDGMDYIGDPSLPFSTTTWDDPNHSFRTWGNDGTSFNRQLTIFDNAMVGPEIAQALVAAAANSGHLPVYLEMRMPPKLDADIVIDFGTVLRGSTIARKLHISNDGNIQLWTVNGIAPLHYSMLAEEPFIAPAGSFTAYAGDAESEHDISLDTSKAGVFRKILSIVSNAPDQRVWIVRLSARVIESHR